MKPKLERARVDSLQVAAALALCPSILGPAPVRAQSPLQQRSAKDVLETYRRFDAQGRRLTAKGWSSASAFFVGHGWPGWSGVMAVDSDERGDDPDPWFKGKNKTEISVICTEFGQVDSFGRFTSMTQPPLIDASGRVLRPVPTPLTNGPVPVNRVYTLVLADSHWEPHPPTEEPREAKGPPEWRIETFEFEPHVTIDAAIRYLTELRDTSNNQTIRRNASKSIAELQGIRAVGRFRPMQ